MKIAFVGSGNVASHLAVGLHEAGHEILGVLSRTHANARELAEKIGCEALPDASSLSDINPDAVILSIADAAAISVIESLPTMPSAVVLHTSGTLPQEILLPISPNAGILYPLQTFSRNVAVNLAEVPFFIEGATERAADVAGQLARSLSPNVHYADAEHRKALHIAGVLSCNFPNFLWECCGRILEEAGYPFKVVEPLVRATVDKAFSVGPHAAQTGPARRGDVEVIEAHIRALPPELAEIYRRLSNEIIKSHS